MKASSSPPATATCSPATDEERAYRSILLLLAFSLAVYVLIEFLDQIIKHTAPDERPAGEQTGRPVLPRFALRSPQPHPGSHSAARDWHEGSHTRAHP